MSTASENARDISEPAAAVTSKPPQRERLASLDAFRGLVIVTMIFVNYLAGVQEIPGWAKHYPQDLDGYTFVDLVFPAFLFIVGVALPLSFTRRRSSGQNAWTLLGRVAVRSASLILVGVIMVNTGSYSAEATGMSKHLWFLLAMSCVLVAWSELPAQHHPGANSVSAWLKWCSGKYFHRSIRIGALVLLIVLLMLFRGRNSAEATVWLQHSWWGILGLIGWAYLVSSVIYILSRGDSTVMMGATAFLLALYVGDRHGVLDWFGTVKDFIAVGPVLGSTAANVMLGVIVGTTFLKDDWDCRKRVGFMLLFAIGLFATGALLRPVHGINKVAATEAYTLVAGAWSCAGFAAIYYIMDIKRWRGWARWLVPVGQNPVLAYVLPGLLANLTGLFGWERALWFSARSWTGALNSLGVTLLVVALTWGATRVGLRVRL